MESQGSRSKILNKIKQALKKFTPVQRVLVFKHLCEGVSVRALCREHPKYNHVTLSRWFNREVYPVLREALKDYDIRPRRTARAEAKQGTVSPVT